MFQKILILLTILCVSISLIGCGGTDKKTTEEIKVEIDTVYNMIDDINAKCDFIAVFAYDQWNIGRTFDFLYNEDSWAEANQQYFGDEYKLKLKLAHEYRAATENDLSAIKDMLKEITPNEETQAYYDAVKELYLCVNTYQSFACYFPDGYSKITFADKMIEHQEEYERLISEVEFEQ